MAASTRCCRARASSARSPVSVLRRSARITAGSVSPCPTSVSTMTVKVTMTSASRAGNGWPPGPVRGNASAAASETTPRMPAQERTSEHSSASLPTVDPLGQEDGGENPQSADDHEQHRHGHAEADQPDRLVQRQHAQEQRNLQAHDDEDEAVQQECDRLPYGSSGQPRVRAHDLRATVSHVEAGRHRRRSRRRRRAGRPEETPRTG